MYGFKPLRWYGLRRQGLMANDRWGKVVIAVLGVYDTPSIKDFGPEPQPNDEIVELKLTVKKKSVRK